MVVLIITTLTWKPTSSQATDQSCRDGDRIKMGSRFEECSYVKQKMRFCTWPKIKIHCAKSCGQCGDPSLCLDSTEAFRLIEEGVITSCKKIKDDTGNLCNNVIVKKICPVSCNNCPCVDTTKPVWVDSVKKGQSCEKIAKNLVHCEDIQVQTKCPQTCNTCPSQPPTDQPTRLPSQHPIDQPSNHPTDQPTHSSLPSLSSNPTSHSNLPTFPPSNEQSKDPTSVPTMHFSAPPSSLSSNPTSHSNLPTFPPSNEQSKEVKYGGKIYTCGQIEIKIPKNDKGCNMCQKDKIKRICRNICLPCHKSAVPSS